MFIRRAKTADADAVAQVQVRSWQAAYPGIIPQSYLDAMETGPRARRWEQWLDRARWPGAGMLVAEGADGLVAFANFAPGEAGPTDTADTVPVPEVEAFYSLPEVWGSGVNERLMAAVTDALREAGYTEATLWVLAANERARRFYSARGWRTSGEVTKEGPVNGVVVPRVRYGLVLI